MGHRGRRAASLLMKSCCYSCSFRSCRMLRRAPCRRHEFHNIKLQWANTKERGKVLQQWKKTWKFLRLRFNDFGQGQHISDLTGARRWHLLVKGRYRSFQTFYVQKSRLCEEEQLDPRLDLTSWRESGNPWCPSPMEMMHPGPSWWPSKWMHKQRM